MTGRRGVISPLPQLAPSALPPGLMAGPTSPLLTVEQVAERLQVSPRTVRRWTAGGALPVVQFGRAVRVRPADLQRLIETGVAS